MEMSIFIGAVLYPAHGTWLGLPASDAEIKAAIAKAQTPDCEEVIIADCEGIACSEYSNIYEVNEQAKRIDNLTEDGQIVVEALMDYYDLDEAISIAEDEDYTLWYDCDTMGDLAYQYYEDTGMINEVPEWAQPYIDYEAIGRDFEINGHFIRLNNIDGFLEIYNR